MTIASVLAFVPPCLRQPAGGCARRSHAHPRVRRKRHCVLRAGGQDFDVQVFRFTLGIPGFDDTNIPRVVGCLGAVVLLVNHVLGAQPPPSAQVVGEVVGSVLAVILFSLPTLESRLKDASGTRGRREASDSIAGAIQAFALDKQLPEAVAKELAWTSFALLRNTNTCGVVVVRNGAAVLARGALGEQAVDRASPRDSLPKITESMRDVSTSTPQIFKELGPEGLYMPDRSSMSARGVSQWGITPSGAQAALLIPLSSTPAAARDYMLVFSEFPRGISARERPWVLSMAAKVAGILP